MGAVVEDGDELPVWLLGVWLGEAETELEGVADDACEEPGLGVLEVLVLLASPDGDGELDG